jgi:hypothetical protein
MTSEEAARLGGLAAVLDGGPAPGGVPSTLLDLSGSEARILREGPIPAESLLGPALEETFGALPDLEVPSRGDWDRGRPPR